MGEMNPRGAGWRKERGFEQRALLSLAPNLLNTLPLPYSSPVRLVSSFTTTSIIDLKLIPDKSDNRNVNPYCPQLHERMHVAPCVLPAREPDIVQYPISREEEYSEMRLCWI